jgi:outer membrane protein TolC
MSVIDCIKIALDNNYSLVQERTFLDVKLRDMKEKDRARIPSLSLTSTYGYTSKDRPGLATSDVGLKLTQPIYDKGKIGYEQEKSFVNYEKQRLKYIVKQNNVIYNANYYYFNMIREEKLLDISKSAQEDSKKLFDIAQARFRAGDIAEIEVLKAEVEVAQTQDDIIFRQNSRDKSRDSLIRFLDMEFGIEIIPTEELQYSPFKLTMEECLQTASLNRPELISSKYDIELALLDLEQEKRNILPDIALSGNLRYSIQNELLPTTTYQFLLNGSWDLPLYDRGKRGNLIKNYEEYLELSNLSYTQLQKDVMLEVINGYRDLKALENRIELRQKIVAQAQQNLDATQLQYKMGLVTILEVTTTTQALTSAKVNSLQSLIDFQLAKEKMALVTGMIGEPWHIEPADEGNK